MLVSIEFIDEMYLVIPLCVYDLVKRIGFGNE